MPRMMLTPIRRAEFSVDAGDWQYLEPVGQLSDAKTENYDFNVLLNVAPRRPNHSLTRNAESKNLRPMCLRLQENMLW